jgi:hypothetical protein
LEVLTVLQFNDLADCTWVDSLSCHHPLEVVWVPVLERTSVMFICTS